MELGGDFNLRLEGLELQNDTILDYLRNYYTVYLDSGRSGLRLIRDVLPDGEILLPEYLCNSVLQSFNGMDIRFYKLNSNLEINIEDLSNKLSDTTKAVYIMHYFGAVQPVSICSLIQEMKTQHDFIIIEDTTQSIFSNPRTIGDYCISSLRKWFAIPDGGVLYSHQLLDNFTIDTLQPNKDIRKTYAMILKTLYLDGTLDCNAIYRGIFQSTEDVLDKRDEIRLISSVSEYLLRCHSIEKIILKRKQNFQQLHDGLSSLGLTPVCPINSTDCPFTFPVRVRNRDRFKKYLIDNRIYCAVHWPLTGTVLNDIEKSRNLSEQIISLPIDQRYGSEDIQYLLEVINKYEGISLYGDNLAFT